MKKFFKYFLWVVGLLLLGVYIIFRFFLNVAASEEDIAAFFAKHQIEPQHEYYEVEGHTMHYVTHGSDTLPTILFIHGCPGTWDAFYTYFADSLLMPRARMISVDRIGYGQSELGKAESSLIKQVDYLMPIFETIPDSVPVIVVGHSFGGPVSYRLAMNHPEMADAVVILAGFSDPELENRQFLKPFTWKALRWLLPQDMEICNREIVPLRKELEDMMPMWEKVTSPMWIIQGDKDVLVEAENADFAKEKMVNAQVTLTELPEANHFLPWVQYRIVRDTLVSVLDYVEK